MPTESNLYICGAIIGAEHGAGYSCVIAVDGADGSHPGEAHAPVLDLDNDDVRQCETCDAIVYVDDGTDCEMSGCFTCQTCADAEYAYLMRQMPRFPADWQLRQDDEMVRDAMADFTPDDKEWRKLATLLNR